MSINPIPSRNPTTAGTYAKVAISAEASIAGMSNDHTEAAIITPEAKPSRMRWMRSANLSLKNSTDAAPMVVPANGINSSGIISEKVIYIALFQRQI
jgi:hypothetical protein